MDVDKALRELYEEKTRLDQAITALERGLRALNREAPKRTPRGRKNMGPEERLEVSRRMAAYWEAKRAQSRPLKAKESDPGTVAEPEHRASA